ncbi:MAG: molybdopterin-binding protein [Proteobacteria bacterium]|nr:molybdopterin-binding protein [Pseudomonadota bacterium]MBU1708533.1 molybdopterin-binding protein [Pseudomonadota bacterium]
MQTKIPLEKSMGMVLPHDITEIRPPSKEGADGQGQFKGRAFKKGHIIREEDIPRLKNLGKEHIFVLKLGPDDIHENEAAEKIASALSGPGSRTSGEPKEGKINILADTEGLLKIDVQSLLEFNLLEEVVCASLHNNTPVKKDEVIAGTRLLPLVGSRKIVNQAIAIAARNNGIIQVKQLKRITVGLVITGNEVFHGRIKDAFAPVLTEKLASLGSKVTQIRFAPDDPEVIAKEIKNCLDCGVELIITSGGMSVDPDDVTRLGIQTAGATDIMYGSPVLPGSMFLVARIGTVPVIGVPACGMFHKITVFDLVLPRMLAGEQLSRKDIALMGHGGLCRLCKHCSYPICGFGK